MGIQPRDPRTLLKDLRNSLARKTQAREITRVEDLMKGRWIRAVTLVVPFTLPRRGDILGPANRNGENN